MTYEDKANTVKKAVVYWCILYVVCILIHTIVKMDYALTPYFIIAAVWNGMEHRECIGGDEKTKHKLSNLVELAKGGEQ